MNRQASAHATQWARPVVPHMEEAPIMPRFSRFLLLFAVLLVPWGCGDVATDELMAPDGVDAKLTDAPGITVMSQNLYLGVDLGVLLTATTPEQIAVGLQQLVTTNALDATNPALGPRRMLDIAMSIADEAPHLVGLQEVSHYTFTFADNSQVVLDFRAVLEGLLNYLHATGYTPYTWSWEVNQLVAAPTINLPVMGGIAVDFVDSDAILVRNDVSVTGTPVGETFDAVQMFNVFGTVFPFYRGYGAVTVEVEGHELVFANTHLEVQQFEDVQVAQTAEFIEFIDDQSLPVIALGDFNSAANHDAPEDQTSGSYRMLVKAGLADFWLREAHSVGGVTCCQAGDLTNPTSELTQRLDLILADWGPAGFGGQSTMHVVGEEPADRIAFTAVSPFGGDPFPLALWPSDHAGVVATLWPAPGRSMERPGH